MNQRTDLLAGVKRDPQGWAGSDIRDMLKSFGFVYGAPEDGHWYIVHREKEFWDLDMYLPTWDPVDISVALQAAELVEEFLGRNPSP